MRSSVSTRNCLSHVPRMQKGVICVQTARHERQECADFTLEDRGDTERADSWPRVPVRAMVDCAVCGRGACRKTHPIFGQSLCRRCLPGARKHPSAYELKGVCTGCNRRKGSSRGHGGACAVTTLLASEQRPRSRRPKPRAARELALAAQSAFCRSHTIAASSLPACASLPSKKAHPATIALLCCIAEEFALSLRDSASTSYPLPSR